MILNQRDVDASCEAALAVYTSLNQREARLKFSAETQGFVASEVNRGASLEDAIKHVERLLKLIKRAQVQL